MITDAAKSAFSYARRLSPIFVAKRPGGDADIRVGYYGQVGPSATNRVLSFQGSLSHELGITSVMQSIEDGCFECTFSIGGSQEAQRLSGLIEQGQFDSLAYRYRILFVRFLTDPDLDEVHFERDSLFR